MPPSNLSQKLSTLAGAWPQDPLRPNLQLKNFLKSLSTHPNLTPKAVEAAQDLQRDAALKKVCITARLAVDCGVTTCECVLIDRLSRSISYQRRRWSLRPGRITTRVWWRATTRACRALRGRGGKCSSMFGRWAEEVLGLTFLRVRDAGVEMGRAARCVG